MKIFVLFLILTALPVIAEEPWPKKVAAPIFSAIASAELPKTLQSALLGFDDYEQGSGHLPDELQVCRVRLKENGLFDYIVMVPDGFSGGPEVHIFEPVESKFVAIGFNQGLRYFGPRVGGYYQLICQGRGGTGAFVRTLWQYQHGRYHAVRATDYQLNEMGGELKFVRERDPKELSSW